MGNKVPRFLDFIRYRTMLAKHLVFLKPEETSLAKLYDSLQFVGGKKEKVKELRASAFPTCPLIWLDNFLFPTKDYQNSYHSTYHTSVGNFVHEYVQRGLAEVARGNLLGAAKCGACGHTEDLTTDFQCPECSEQMEYVELAVKYKLLTGHIDCVLVDFVKDNRGKVIRVKLQVSDYKTCSLEDKRYLPNKKHLLQAAIYGALIERKLKKHYADVYPDAEVLVTTLSIFYIPKDKPSKRMEYAIPFSASLRKDAIFMIKYAVKGRELYNKLAELHALPVSEKEKRSAEIRAALLELYSVRTCNACEHQGLDTTPQDYYEERVKPFFFEKVTRLDDKTFFRNECLLERSCMSKRVWLDNVFESFVYPTNMDDTDLVF